MNTHLNISLAILFLFPQEYEKALKNIRTLLKNEPGNNQALDLERLINKALKKGRSPSAAAAAEADHRAQTC